MEEIYMIFDDKDNLYDVLLMSKEECKEYKINHPEFVVELAEELDNLEDDLRELNEDDE
jgi:hypothetical protein